LVGVSASHLFFLSARFSSSFCCTYYVLADDESIRTSALMLMLLYQAPILSSQAISPSASTHSFPRSLLVFSVFTEFIHPFFGFRISHRRPAALPDWAKKTMNA
jgi:hypothetical protein